MRPTPRVVAGESPGARTVAVFGNRLCVCRRQRPQSPSVPSVFSDTQLSTLSCSSHLEQPQVCRRFPSVVAEQRLLFYFGRVSSSRSRGATCVPPQRETRAPRAGSCVPPRSCSFPSCPTSNSRWMRKLSCWPF